MDNNYSTPPRPFHPNYRPAGKYKKLREADLGLTSESNKVTSKSYAQVESFGSHQNGSQDSGELKLNRSRTSRIVIRFTKEERESVGTMAKKAQMPIANYVRLMVLRQPGLDPERNKLLHKVHFELTKQGTNLNQIAKHLNAKTASPEQGDSMLGIIARSLLSAHHAVQQALADGKEGSCS